MQVTVKDVSTVKKILEIEIPEKNVARQLDKTYQQLKKTAKIKGFRPGKAPRSVLERLYKKDVHSDVTSKIIQDAFFEAVKEKDLKVVGTPQIDPPELEDKKAYKFEATVEVSPDIAEVDFKGITLSRTNYTVSDEEINIQLKMLQKRMAQAKTIEEERPLKAEDLALIDYEGFKNGAAFSETAKTENFSMKIGDGRISKEFDDQLIGMQAGEEKEISVAFAKDYHNDKLAGFSIDFKVKLNEIRQEVLPAIDADFAKDVGRFETLDELKAEIESNLKEGYEKRTEQELNEQVFQALIEKTDFELPEVLVKYELDGIIEETRQSFAYQHKSMEDAGITPESLRENYRETAEKQARRYLILKKVVEQENLTLADEALEKGFADMAANFGQPVEQIKAYYQQNNDKFEFFKHALLEKQAIKLIIDNGQIKNVDPETATKADTKKSKQAAAKKSKQAAAKKTKQ